MKNNSESQYFLLKRLLGFEKEPIELFNLDELPKMRIPKNYEKIVNLIISENKQGNAPLFKYLNETLYDTKIFQDYNSLHKALSLLGENELIITPNIIQFAELLGRRKGVRMDFSLLPRNVSFVLSEYRVRQGKRSWKSRFKNLNANGYPKCCIALFYDKDGPVYKNCFENLELKYKLRKLEVFRFNNPSLNKSLLVLNYHNP
jgi:hypothetical protein